MLTGLLLIVVAYLLGSFPSGVVVGRMTTGRDVREVGSGNIGAANVVRAAGMRAGAVVGLLDGLKGLLPVLLGRWLGLDEVGLALVAGAAVLGHDFSLYLRFSGGKGVATTLGAFLALALPATLIALACWLLVLARWGYSSLASLVALGLLPVFVGFTGRPPVDVVMAGALFLLAVIKHRANIVRLLRGTERGLRKPKPSHGG